MAPKKTKNNKQTPSIDNKSKSKKSIVPIFVRLIMIIFLVFAGYAVFVSNFNEPNQPQDAELQPQAQENSEPKQNPELELTLRQGQAYQYLNNQWESINRGQKLKINDQLKTDFNSQAQLSFGQAVIRLDQNTQILIKDLSSEKIAIQQLRGQTYNRINLSKDNQILSLRNQETTAQTANGGFLFKTPSSTETHIYVINQKVQTNFEQFDQVIEQGQKLIIDHRLSGRQAMVQLPINLENINNSFTAWNKQLDLSAGYNCGIFQYLYSVDQATFLLEAEEKNDLLIFNWQISDNLAPAGNLLLIKSSQSKADYPGDEKLEIKPDQANTSWPLAELADSREKEDLTCYFRLCLFNNSNGCLLYSNQVSYPLNQKQAETADEANKKTDPITQESNQENDNQESVADDGQSADSNDS